MRLAPALHARLRALAREGGVSLNQFCANLLDGSLEARTGAELRSGGLDASRVAAAWGAPLDGLILFGSAARDEAWDTSEIDLMVVLPAGDAVTREHYERWDDQVAPAVPASRPLSPSIVTCPAGEPGGIWYEAAVNGVVLWDPRLRVSALLIDLRRRIAEGAMKRRFAHGQPYWGRRTRCSRNSSLAQVYIARARKRLRAVEVLFEEEDWPDTVREAQEIVELALKASLRTCRIEPPRLHDVSDILIERQTSLPPAAARELPRLTHISRRLRRDRELAFYGSEDLTPSEFYRREDAQEAIEGARFVVETVSAAMEARRGRAWKPPSS